MPGHMQPRAMLRKLHSMQPELIVQRRKRPFGKPPLHLKKQP